MQVQISVEILIQLVLTVSALIQLDEEWSVSVLKDGKEYNAMSIFPGMKEHIGNKVC